MQGKYFIAGILLGGLASFFFASFNAGILAAVCFYGALIAVRIEELIDEVKGKRKG